MMSTVPAIAFLVASVLFIIGIKLLGSPKTARQGNLVAAAGMIIALLATLPLMHGPNDGPVPGINVALIAIGVLAGLGIGAFGAYSVKMTAMPQMVALFNGAGGGAAALVAALEFARQDGVPHAEWFTLAMLFAALIGAVSFSGSIIAFLKLEGKFEKPLTYPGQQFGNAALFIAMIALGVTLTGAAPATGALIAFLVLRARVRRADGAADRRRGHAGGDLVAQFLHRARRGRGWFRHLQHRHDHRRHAGRFLRHAADAFHVQGDEPSGDERSVRRLRQGDAMVARQRPPSAAA